MTAYRPLLCSLLLLLPAQAQFVPEFQLFSANPNVPVGGVLTVEVWVNGVVEATTGYQVEILHPASVTPLAVTQGPYLMFGTFFGSPGAFPDKVRIGALNFPTPTPLPAGQGFGLLATVTYSVDAAGPIHLDLTSFTSMVSTAAATIPSERLDLLATGAGPADILSVSGVPNPGGAVELRTELLGAPGAMVTAAASLGDAGIPVPGVGTVPLTWDPLVDLALAGAYPYTNSSNVVGASGVVTTQVAIPNVPSLVGTRFYFASVAFMPFGGLVISNGLFGDILAN